MTSANHVGTTSAAAAVDRARTEIEVRLRPWLHRREGIASVCLVVVVFWLVWGPMGAPIFTAALLAAFAIVLVSLAAETWESRTAPAPPAFSVVQGPVHGCIELRHDENAGFWRDTRGFLWDSRVWFVGTGCPPCRLSPETYGQLRAWREQSDLPVFITRTRERQWWWWRNEFFWESGDYEPEDLRALLVMLEREDEQGIEWELDIHLGDRIAEDVKHHVFERDRGRCVACGSKELIQYDHVVPSWMGGANDAENIRLLCGGCNRR